MKRKKPKYKLKKDTYSQTKKYDYFKITQENQYLLKRLYDKNSFYDVKSWEKDYDKSQKYKKNLCVFPSIDFRKTKTNNFELGNHSNTNKTLCDKIKLLKFDNLEDRHKEVIRPGADLKTFNTVDHNSQDLNENHYNNIKKILYNRKMLLNELSHCSVTFFIQNKK